MFQPSVVKSVPQIKGGGRLERMAVGFGCQTRDDTVPDGNLRDS